MTKRKYRRGKLIESAIHAANLIRAGKWVFFNNKPLSPEWMGNMRFKTILGLVGKGVLYEAESCGELTRPFKYLVQERQANDPAFRTALSISMSRAQKIAQDFFSQAPKYRTKVNLETIAANYLAEELAEAMDRSPIDD